MENEFSPPKKASLLVLLVLCAVALGLAVSLFVSASLQAETRFFAVKIALAFVLLLIFLVLLYRIYALATTVYTLDQAGLTLRWGLRLEIIPMSDLEWVRPVSEFEADMPLPLLALPKNIYGQRQVEGLGMVEFAATDRSQLVVVAARKRTFVISPGNAAAFAYRFERLTELGSINDFTARSEDLRSLWMRVWVDMKARKLILAGLGAALVLLILGFLLSRLTPSITWVSLDRFPSDRLFFLVLFAFSVWFINFALGLIFYLTGRLEKQLVYYFWAVPVPIAAVLAAAMLIMSL